MVLNILFERRSSSTAAVRAAFRGKRNFPCNLRSSGKSWFECFNLTRSRSRFFRDSIQKKVYVLKATQKRSVFWIVLDIFEICRKGGRADFVLFEICRLGVRAPPQIYLKKYGQQQVFAVWLSRRWPLSLCWLTCLLVAAEPTFWTWQFLFLHYSIFFYLIIVEVLLCETAQKWVCEKKFSESEKKSFLLRKLFRKVLKQLNNNKLW